MRIISQSRDSSLEIKDSVIWLQYEMIHADTGSKGKYILGRYKNQERAREVFAEIHKQYGEKEFVYYMPEE